jgi:hypothetical protein
VVAGTVTNPRRFERSADVAPPRAESGVPAGRSNRTPCSTSDDDDSQILAQQQADGSAEGSTEPETVRLTGMKSLVDRTFLLPDLDSNQEPAG